MEADSSARLWLAELARHAPWLRTVVYARVADASAADDVLQEVSLAAVRQQQQLSDPTKLAPWLYRIALRQVLLHRRRLGRRRSLLKRYADHGNGRRRRAGEPEPGAWLINVESRQAVRAALAQLPPADREILMLKHAEDWTYEQIAERLGLSRDKVKYRLWRARRGLRRLLADEEKHT